jgi:membrane protein YdbS with pleckstrin-like domain
MREIMEISYEAQPAWRNQWMLIVFVILWSAVTTNFFMEMAALEGLDNIISEASMIPPYVGVLLLGIAGLLYRRREWKFIISSEQIESHYGIISKDIKTVRLQDLHNINVKQSASQRILGTGDVEFSSANGSGVEVVFYGVPNPMDLQAKIQNVRE